MKNKSTIQAGYMILSNKLISFLCGENASVVLNLYNSSINNKLIPSNLHFINNIASYFVHFCSINENKTKWSQNRISNKECCCFISEWIIAFEQIVWVKVWMTHSLIKIKVHLFTCFNSESATKSAVVSFPNESLPWSESFAWRIEWLARILSHLFFCVCVFFLNESVLLNRSIEWMTKWLIPKDGHLFNS